MPRTKSKTAWFDAGFSILKSSGAAALTIDTLTDAMGRTKGAFYHHFKSREDYSRGLLEIWEDRQADEIIRISKQKATFHEINQTLIDLSEKAMDPEIEVAIRAWALQDPLAREFQERIDRHRVEFLVEMFGLMGTAPDHAELFATIRYCFYIGSHQIIPAMGETEYKTRLARLTRMFTLCAKEPL